MYYGDNVYDITEGAETQCEASFDGVRCLADATREVHSGWWVNYACTEHAY